MHENTYLSYIRQQGGKNVNLEVQIQKIIGFNFEIKIPLQNFFNAMNFFILFCTRKFLRLLHRFREKKIDKLSQYFSFNSFLNILTTN